MRHGCEDWDFWLRLVEAGYQGTIIPEVLFYYRRHAASMSRGMIEAQRIRRRSRRCWTSTHRPYRDHLATVMVSKEAERLAPDAKSPRSNATV